MWQRLRAKFWPIFVLAFLLSVFMEHFFFKLSRASEQTRSPRFAGSWYPAQAEVLNNMLSTYLGEAKSQLSSKPASEGPGKNVIAIIAPHAGYIYSGRTAAFAYASLSNSKCKRVFLLGPSHYVSFSGAALPSQSIFETPIGNLEIEQATVKKLLQAKGFQQIDGVFDVEHSLELQLPWIYKTLPKVKLIPMAIGNVDREIIAQIADAIKKELHQGDVIIISSDFTHYGPRFDYQPFNYETTIAGLKEKIGQLDKEAFNCLKTIDNSKLLEFYQRTHDTICGIYPSTILLSLLPADAEAKLLNYRTSQDVEKDLEGNSVSYMAIAFSCPKGTHWPTTQEIQSGTIQPSKKADEVHLTPSDGQVLLKLARQAVQDYLSGDRKEPSAYIKLLTPHQADCFKEECGVFVTLYEKPQEQISAQKMGSDTEPDKHKQLRGCIGYIYPVKSLLAAVCENAINAATADPRFNPVTADELGKLDLEINVLTKPTPIASWHDIKLGEDGIILKKAGRQAVFLPKVPTEFGWDLAQTLGQLSLKAGLSPVDWYDAEFEVFQSQVFN